MEVFYQESLVHQIKSDVILDQKKNQKDIQLNVDFEKLNKNGFFQNGFTNKKFGDLNY